MRERHVFIWYCTWLACLFVKLQHDKTVDNPQEGSFVKHFKISKADPTLAFSSRNLYVHTYYTKWLHNFGGKFLFWFFGFAIFSCCMIAYSHSFYKTEIIQVIIRRGRWRCQYESVQGQYILGLFIVMSFLLGSWFTF